MPDSTDKRKLDRQHRDNKVLLPVGKFYWFGFLFLFLVFALLFPYRFEYSWAFFSSLSVLDVALAVLFIPVTLVAVTRGRIAVGDRKVFFVLLMPLIFAFISIIWSINTSATFKSVVVCAAAVVVILLAVNLSAEYSFDRLSLFFIVIPLLLIVTSIASYFPGSPFKPELTMLSQALNQDGFLLSYYARLSHPFIGLSNSFATILAMFLPFIFLVNRAGLYKRSSWWVIILTFGAIIATGSRGVLLAVVIVYMGLFFLESDDFRSYTHQRPIYCRYESVNCRNVRAHQSGCSEAPFGSIK